MVMNVKTTIKAKVHKSMTPLDVSHNYTACKTYSISLGHNNIQDLLMYKAKFRLATYLNTSVHFLAHKQQTNISTHSSSMSLPETQQYRQ